MPPQGNQCPYCQLIENPQQLMVVGETENFYAWLEVQPRAKGHTQIVPKDHKENVLEFSPEEYDEAMGLVREVVVKAKKGLGADGASVTVNIGDAGGQMLDHAYISVFPRFEEDENAETPTGAIFQHREDLQDEEKLKGFQEEMSSVNIDFGEPKEPHPESKRFKEENDEAEKDHEEDDDQYEEPSEEEKTERDVRHEGKSFEMK